MADRQIGAMTQAYYSSTFISLPLAGPSLCTRWLWTWLEMADVKLAGKLRLQGAPPGPKSVVLHACHMRMIVTVRFHAVIQIQYYLYHLPAWNHAIILSAAEAPCWLYFYSLPSPESRSAGFKKDKWNTRSPPSHVDPFKGTRKM